VYVSRLDLVYGGEFVEGRSKGTHGEEFENEEFVKEISQVEMR
jgi:hypothetical protein